MSFFSQLRRGLLLLVAVLGMAQFATGAVPALLCLTSGNIIEVDLETGGVVKDMGTVGKGMTDIALSPTGKLYAIDFQDLYEIDLLTLVAKDLGSYGMFGANGLEFVGDELLVARSGELFQIDVGTLATRKIAEFPYSTAGDIVQLSADGDIYLSTSQGDGLLINPGTGNWTNLGNTGMDDLYGVAFRNGTLYGVRSSGEIHAIDTHTGVASSIAAISPGFLQGASIWGATVAP